MLIRASITIEVVLKKELEEGEGEDLFALRSAEGLRVKVSTTFLLSL